MIAPYMHDGRFRTLEDCIDDYNTSFHYAKNLDGSLVINAKCCLIAQDRAELIALLNTLTVSKFVRDPKFAMP